MISWADWAIPLAALVISVATMLMTYWAMKNAARNSHVDRVEDKVTKLEEDLKTCLRERANLERERHQLLFELVEARRRLDQMPAGDR